MLRKCYGYRGWRGTSSGEVSRQAKGDARPDAGPRAGAGTSTLVYIRTCRQAGKLGAGSWKANESLDQAAKCQELKGDKNMFYVVDEWGQLIREFSDRDTAETYCKKWNEKFRFSEWTAPKAHIIVEE